MVTVTLSDRVIDMLAALDELGPVAIGESREMKASQVCVSKWYLWQEKGTGGGGGREREEEGGRGREREDRWEREEGREMAYVQGKWGMKWDLDGGICKERGRGRKNRGREDT